MIILRNNNSFNFLSNWGWFRRTQKITMTGSVSTWVPVIPASATGMKIERSKSCQIQIVGTHSQHRRASYTRKMEESKSVKKHRTSRLEILRTPSSTSKDWLVEDSWKRRCNATKSFYLTISLRVRMEEQLSTYRWLTTSIANYYLKRSLPRCWRRWSTVPIWRRVDL